MTAVKFDFVFMEQEDFEKYASETFCKLAKRFRKYKE
jgi:hypothetical protein